MLLVDDLRQQVQRLDVVRIALDRLAEMQDGGTEISAALLEKTEQFLNPGVFGR
jgi:hypothetical protein